MQRFHHCKSGPNTRYIVQSPAGKEHRQMIIMAGMILGVALGSVTAKRRGGRALDMLQYGAGYGIAFTLVGVFVTIILERSL